MGIYKVAYHLRTDDDGNWNSSVGSSLCIFLRSFLDVPAKSASRKLCFEKIFLSMLVEKRKNVFPARQNNYFPNPIKSNIKFQFLKKITFSPASAANFRVSPVSKNLFFGVFRLSTFFIQAKTIFCNHKVMIYVVCFARNFYQFPN